VAVAGRLRRHGRSYQEAGVNEFIVDQPAAEQLPMAERIAAELLPKLRTEAAI